MGSESGHRRYGWRIALLAFLTIASVPLFGWAWYQFEKPLTPGEFEAAIARNPDTMGDLVDDLRHEEFNGAVDRCYEHSQTAPSSGVSEWVQSELGDAPFNEIRWRGSASDLARVNRLYALSTHDVLDWHMSDKPPLTIYIVSDARDRILGWTRSR
jgi:hypothetical protein